MRARARRPDDADVEDLVPEVLLSVHAPARPGMRRGRCYPWIAAIARYRPADNLRCRGRAGRLVDEVSRIAETFVMFGPNRPSEEVINSMSMTRAMDKLSETERRAFTLVRLRGL